MCCCTLCGQAKNLGQPGQVQGWVLVSWRPGRVGAVVVVVVVPAAAGLEVVVGRDDDDGASVAAWVLLL